MKSKNAVLIPAGPRDDFLDTIESVRHFEPDADIYVIQDFSASLNFPANVIVLPPLPWPKNTYGGLLQKKLWAFDFILKNSAAEIILTLDADALILRQGAFIELEKYFSNRSIGAAGSYKLGPSGIHRDFSPIKRSLIFRGLISALQLNIGTIALIQRIFEARKAGYQLGEHPLGCSVFYKRAMLETWRDLGWLSPNGLQKINVADDGLLGLLVRASGYEVAEIGGPGQVLNVGWRGLPASPSDIVKSNAYITHSVRSFQSLNEVQIREFFRNLRV